MYTRIRLYNLILGNEIENSYGSAGCIIICSYLENLPPTTLALNEYD